MWIWWRKASDRPLVWGILEKLADGVEDPQELVQLAKGRLRNKIEELTEALKGLMQPHHRFMLREQLLHVSDLETVIAEVEREIGDQRLSQPF